MKRIFFKILICTAFFISCESNDSNNDITVEKNTPENINNTPETLNTENNTPCTLDQELDSSRGNCNIKLDISNTVSTLKNSNNRVITANNIPNHNVGLFGGGQGSLNPNAISAQNSTYSITLAPLIANTFTPLLQSTGTSRLGPQYSFGVLLNGIELDPVAAEPFPHNRDLMDPNLNWEWNLEALGVNLGLDCNNAHVQPSGKYHYHGIPNLYIDNLNTSSNTMTLIGYAADGFPIYLKYAYEIATDNTSNIIEMTSSYRLKSGNRPGDGITAPCDAYDGVYSNDYEFISNLGTLDQANGRTGVTPEFPNGTYYYIITNAFPSIPRFFRGTPSNSFKIGR